MDVIFHEDTMYFHNTDLQGDKYKEVKFFRNTYKEEIGSVEVPPNSTTSSPSTTMPTEDALTENTPLPNTNNQPSTFYS